MKNTHNTPRTYTCTALQALARTQSTSTDHLYNNTVVHMRGDDDDDGYDDDDDDDDDDDHDDEDGFVA